MERARRREASGRVAPLRKRRNLSRVEAVIEPNRNVRSFEQYRRQSPSGEAPLHEETHDLEAGIAGDKHPRFSCPLSACPASTSHESKPLMIYIPGLDGTSLASAPQLPSLASSFRLEALTLPQNNRSSLDELTAFLTSYLTKRIEQEKSLSFNTKPVLYLLGESLGALLAMSVAQDTRKLVDRLVLVNPASSFDRSVWSRTAQSLPELPPEVYRTLPYAFAPILGNPIRLALRRVADNDVNRLEQLQNINQLLQVPYEALSMLLQMNFLGDLLPPETIRHRIEYGCSGARIVNSRLGDIQVPTAVITGGNDLLLPSTEEGERLMRSIPNCRTYNLPESSHALMLEGGVDICSILHRMEFLPPPESEQLSGFGTGFSLADSVSNEPGFSLPTPSGISSTKNGVQMTRKLLSPQFFSRHHDGAAVHGLDAVRDERPMIFVGPHQLFSLDLGVIIDELLRDKNMLLRGLAHRAIFTGAGGQRHNANGETSGDSENQLKGFFESFGAVNVSGKALFELMRKKEAALLFPGGVNEAYKAQKDKYKLFWSETPEFVRIAMRFGATIVPFGAVGLEDCFTVLLEAQQQLAIPGLREYVQQRMQGIPAVRDDELFVAPLALPTTPRRLYVSFGKPIRTAGMDYKDYDAAADLYANVKHDVESEIDWLLERRKHDPYDDPWRRLPYEAFWGKQAPTFGLEEGAELRS